MPTPTFEDYLNLSIEQFFMKHNNEAFLTAVEGMKKTVAETQDAKVKKDLEKALATMSKNNLSPSVGAYVGFVVKEGDAPAEVRFMTFDDARKRGLRLNVNGTAEKGIDKSHEDTLNREMEEELMRHPKFSEVRANAHKANLKVSFPIETKKVDVKRFSEGKFCYYSCQYVLIDTNRVYSSQELNEMIEAPNKSVHQLQAIAAPLIKLKLLSDKASQEETNALLVESKNAAEALFAWDADGDTINPMTVTQRKGLLDDFSANSADLKKLQKSVDKNVMAYTEANGFGFVAWNQLKADLSNADSAKAYFAPNAEAMQEVIKTKSAAFEKFLVDAVGAAQTNEWKATRSSSATASTSTTFATNSTAVVVADDQMKLDQPAIQM